MVKSLNSFLNYLRVSIFKVFINFLNCHLSVHISVNIIKVATWYIKVFIREIINFLSNLFVELRNLLNIFQKIRSIKLTFSNISIVIRIIKKEKSLNNTNFFLSYSFGVENPNLTILVHNLSDCWEY